MNYIITDKYGNAKGMYKSYNVAKKNSDKIKGKIWLISVGDFSNGEAEKMHLSRVGLK